MHPKSLRLLQQAVRINPSAKIATIAQAHPRSKDDLAEALLDVYVDTLGKAPVWDQSSWDLALEEVDNDPRTLGEFMETPAVRAMIRAQEANNAVA